MRLIHATSLLILGILPGVESYGQQGDSVSGDSEGFFPGSARERSFPPDLIRESGCLDGDTQCLEIAAGRYARRLPEGFSREPDCVEGTVCVAESVSITHDDFLTLLELVSPGIQQDWNVRIDNVMTSRIVLLVTAESDRQRNGRMEWVDGAEMLVEWEMPGGWSILRGSLYHYDLAPTAEAEGGDSDPSANR